jgi:hypothetical protein
MTRPRASRVARPPLPSPMLRRPHSNAEPAAYANRRPSGDHEGPLPRHARSRAFRVLTSTIPIRHSSLRSHRPYATRLASGDHAGS